MTEDQAIMCSMAGRVAEEMGSEAGWKRIRTGADSTRYHESGHAVVSRHFGKKTYCIEIFSNGGRTCYSPNSKSGGSDQEHIALFVDLKNHFGELVDLVELECKTENLLRANWRAVQRLAEALEINGGYLNAEQIAEILEKANREIKPAPGSKSDEQKHC